MEFTKKNSIQEIAETPGIKESLPFFFPMELFDWVPKKYWTKPLEEVEQKVRMPWGPPFASEVLLHSVNTINEVLSSPDKYGYVPLWSGEREDYVPDYGKNSRESVCLLTVKGENREKRPVVVICPGGGYKTLARDVEGYIVAKKMLAAGYQPFILNYRVAPNRYPSPHRDLAMAIKYLRANQERCGVDGDRLMIMGFSAAGHLCATFAAYYEEHEREVMEELRKDCPALYEKYRGISVRPDMVCLGYPVINFEKDCDNECYMALTGGDESLREKITTELRVDERYPKTFVWACEDDALVPCDSAVWMGEALKRAGVPSLLRLYPTGGHGCGAAEGTSAEPWMGEMLHFMGGQ